MSIAAATRSYIRETLDNDDKMMTLGIIGVVVAALVLAAVVTLAVLVLTGVIPASGSGAVNPHMIYVPRVPIHEIEPHISFRG